MKRQRSAPENRDSSIHQLHSDARVKENTDVHSGTQNKGLRQKYSRTGMQRASIKMVFSQTAVLQAKCGV